MTAQPDRPRPGVAVFTYRSDGTKQVCIRCEDTTCPTHGDLHDLDDVAAEFGVDLDGEEKP